MGLEVAERNRVYDKQEEEMREAIAETNRIFRDFGIKKRVNFKDWKTNNVIQLENYRKKIIYDYLDSVEV